MVAISGGALRRPRAADVRLLDRRAAFDLGPSEGAALSPPLRLPQTGLADRLLLDRLRGQGLVDAAGLVAAQAAHLRSGIPAIDQLVATGVPARTLLLLTAEAASAEFLAEPFAGNPGLIDQMGLQTCLARSLAPLYRAGGAVVIATARPTEALRYARNIRQRLGPFRLVLAEESLVIEAILAVRGQTVAERAHLSVPYSQSCRGLTGGALRRLTLPIFAAISLATLAFPLQMLGLFTAVAVLFLLATTFLRGLALRAAMKSARQAKARLGMVEGGGPLSREGTKQAAGQTTIALAQAKAPRESSSNPTQAQVPIISVLVPLLREDRVAERLVRRLSLLDYPRERLEILLIVEARDRVTQAALRRTALPPWMRVVMVPFGPVQTKPRALNYAMAQARGSIIGVYDAEDAPEPDQLQKVARTFASAPPELVCLQGALDFYNPAQSLLTSLFTLDYASWFRVMLPGIARLGLVLPLGGTTLFFRRPALEALGGWDAWNVTEDADLGLRLARRGWQTGLLPSTTYEEATSQILPWVRQRSRWIKGYAMTWACHMRQPNQLWRDLGPRRFLALQLMFLAPVLQPLLAPFLWSFWLLAFGLPHPLAPLLGWTIWLLIGFFLLAEALTMVMALIALRSTRHRGLGIWVPLLQCYGWLATFAAWKAVAELMRNPFYWDKTSHGHSRARAKGG